jgi:hypothetical protein
MKLKLLAATLFFSLGLAKAETRAWTVEEKVAGTALAAALLADWSSTRYAARHGWQGVYETNQLLGQTPTPQRVDLHFLVGIPLLYWGLDQFDKNRLPLILGFTAVEVVAARNNLRVGLKFQF